MALAVRGSQLTETKPEACNYGEKTGLYGKARI